ncbi:MAG: Peptidase M22 glycoprotease [Candidatus Tokpelaia sp. JSC085]|nr:MAG: Peptidase M22 glycoprotease [Candidatus Tokpelaia sp. JSC085]
MLVLAIDTASVFCAVCLFNNNRILAEKCDNIGKRHAEYLIGQIATVIEKGQKSLTDIDHIGINIGPGSFTGERIGISVARGLALALDRPAIGISAFEALAFEAAEQYKNHPVSVVFEAYREKLYIQHFDIHNRKTCEPRVDTAERIIPELVPASVLTGSGAQKIAQITQHPVANTAPTASIATYAFLSTRKIFTETRPFQAPCPLYIRTMATGSRN